MKISIPKLSLVVLTGPSGSGKSTFARKHFLPTEVLSSDACRALVSDEENNQAVTNDAFEVLHFIAAKRLALGRLTVIDATNVQPEARKPLVELARKFHCLPVAIVLNLPERLCQERNRLRDERNFGPHVVRQQQSQLRRSLRGLGSVSESVGGVFRQATPADLFEGGRNRCVQRPNGRGLAEKDLLTQSGRRSCLIGKSPSEKFVEDDDERRSTAVSRLRKSQVYAVTSPLARSTLCTRLPSLS